jgi:hypothetical protein
MTTNVFKLAPAGIDLATRREWQRERFLTARIRSAMTHYRTVYSFQPDLFLSAARDYVAGIELAAADDPRGPKFRRLARAHARRIHRDMVNELVLVRAGVRRALMGNGSCPILAS